MYDRRALPGCGVRGNPATRLRVDRHESPGGVFVILGFDLLDGLTIAVGLVFIAGLVGFELRRAEVRDWIKRQAKRLSE